MTREEAIEELRSALNTYAGIEIDDRALEMAIRALEQESCEDAISRQEVEALLAKYSFNRPGWYTFAYQMAK